MLKNIQIAKLIFLKTIDSMKKTLDLAEALFDMRTKQFKFFKTQLMDIVYNNLNKLFKHLEEEKIIKKCPCGANLRKGYKSCLKCNGSGYCNADK